MSGGCGFGSLETVGVTEEPDVALGEVHSSVRVGDGLLETNWRDVPGESRGESGMVVPPGLGGVLWEVPAGGVPGEASAL